MPRTTIIRSTALVCVFALAPKAFPDTLATQSHTIVLSAGSSASASLFAIESLRRFDNSLGLLRSITLDLRAHARYEGQVLFDGGSNGSSPGGEASSIFPLSSYAVSNNWPSFLTHGSVSAWLFEDGTAQDPPSSDGALLVIPPSFELLPQPNLTIIEDTRSYLGPGEFPYRWDGTFEIDWQQFSATLDLSSVPPSVLQYFDPSLPLPTTLLGAVGYADIQLSSHAGYAPIYGELFSNNIAWNADELNVNLEVALTITYTYSIPAPAVLAIVPIAMCARPSRRPLPMRP